MPGEVVKRLRDRRLNVWEQAKELAEKAAEENRSFSQEEQNSWDGLNAEIDALDRRIKSMLEGEQREADAAAAFDKLEGKPVTRGGKAAQQRATAGGEGADTSTELRAFLRGDAGTPRFFDVRPAGDGPVNYRALLTSGSASATVPTSFYDRLVAHLIEVSGILQANPTMLNTSSGENLTIPKTTAHSTAASAAQGATIASSDPTFSSVTLSSYKYGILLQVARELVDDTGVDLEGYLAMETGRALGNKFGSDLVTGNGTGQPNGLLNLVSAAVTGATGVAGVPNYDNLVDLFYSVISPYRSSRSCFWFMKDTTVGTLRKIKDTTGQPIWQPSMQIGAPDLLLGKPLVTDPFMPATATGAESVAFGDFSTFFVRMVGGVRFERSDEFLFGSDMVAFRAVLRGDGTLVDQTGAIKSFVGPST